MEWKNYLKLFLVLIVLSAIMVYVRVETFTLKVFFLDYLNYWEAIFDAQDYIGWANGGGAIISILLAGWYYTLIHLGLIAIVIKWIRN